MPARCNRASPIGEARGRCRTTLTEIERDAGAVGDRHIVDIAADDDILHGVADRFEEGDLVGGRPPGAAPLATMPNSRSNCIRLTSPCSSGMIRSPASASAASIESTTTVARATMSAGNSCISGV